MRLLSWPLYQDLGLVLAVGLVPPVELVLADMVLAVGLVPPVELVRVADMGRAVGVAMEIAVGLAPAAGLVRVADLVRPMRLFPKPMEDITGSVDVARNDNGPCS